MMTRLILFLSLLLSAGPVYAADPAALEEKIYRLVIGPPALLAIPSQTVPSEYSLKLMEDSPVLGGYLINAEPAGGPLVSDFDFVCRLKQKRPDTLMFTDQEGGVTRRYKDLDMRGADKALAMGEKAYYEHILAYSRILRSRCIDVNLAPVVNISRTTPVPYSHPRKIDERRTYSEDIETVKTYAGLFADATYEAGLIPTAKHFPGDILIDKIAGDSPYINKNKGYRMEMNYIDTDFPLEKNIDAFFFERPQFLMWSSNIFTRYSNKPAFMVDEFRDWLKKSECDCLVVSDALDEMSANDETILEVFRSSDMFMMYLPPEAFVKKIANFINQGLIQESDIDQRLEKIDSFKKRSGLK